MFCVGATKAGTSWLYRYLCGHPECHMRAVKELHYFDSLDLDTLEHQRGVLDRTRATVVARMGEEDGAERLAGLARQVADIDEARTLMDAAARQGEASVPRYLDYLFRDAGAARLAADVTPAYALLSQARLAMMARLVPAVRVLYLMRDPVERLWSHIRMAAQRALKPGQDHAEQCGRLLERIIDKGRADHITRRGDYRAAIEKLEAAVPAAELMIEFSERLLTAEGILRLCGFLGLSPREGQVEKRAHVGVPVRMSEEQRNRAAIFLAPQYDFVARRFGSLPEAWQANLARV